MTGDSVRQLLAEISAKTQGLQARNGSPSLVLDSVESAAARMDAALTAVLDLAETTKALGRQSDAVLAVEFEQTVAAALQEQP